MESNSKSGWIDQAFDWLEQQEQYILLKNKWNELDSTSQLYVRAGGVVAAAFGFVFILTSAVHHTSSLKDDVADKTQMLNTLLSAESEMKSLRSLQAGSGGGGGDVVNWEQYILQRAGTSRVSSDQVEVKAQKNNAASEKVAESLLEVTVKGVTLEALVLYAVNLESGPNAMKVRNMKVESTGKDEPVNAVFYVSGFNLLQ